MTYTHHNLNLKNIYSNSISKDYLFSFEEYVELLGIIKEIGSLKDYEDVIAAPEAPFIILRHDVEFSVKRAYDLAIVEHEQNVRSTYFFQVTNNAYNILSGVNVGYLKEILSLGHHVGLHFHLQGCTCIDEIYHNIAYECKLLSNALGVEINRFSFHRPPAFVLEEQIEIPGIINAYNPLFFTYTKDIEQVDFSKSVKYIADSRNEWSYTAPWDKPCKELFLQYPKVQILCHPYSWSDAGAQTLDNLKNLINENRTEFISTLNSETKYVKEYLHEL